MDRYVDHLKHQLVISGFIMFTACGGSYTHETYTEVVTEVEGIGLELWYTDDFGQTYLLSYDCVPLNGGMDLRTIDIDNDFAFHSITIEWQKTYSSIHTAVYREGMRVYDSTNLTSYYLRGNETSVNLNIDGERYHLDTSASMCVL